jgi:RNA polymerase-binding transcription factor
MSSAEPLPPPDHRATPSGPGGAGEREGAAELDRIETDLSDVEIALERLDAGTYWTCEVTGRPLPDPLLAADPVARRLPATAPSAPAAAPSGPAAPVLPPW